MLAGNSILSVICCNYCAETSMIPNLKHISTEKNIVWFRTVLTFMKKMFEEKFFAQNLYQQLLRFKTEI